MKNIPTYDSHFQIYVFHATHRLFLVNSFLENMVSNTDETDMQSETGISLSVITHRTPSQATRTSS